MASAQPIDLQERRAGYAISTPEDRERRTRIMQAIRTGERIPTEDMRDHEYYLQAQHHVLAALGTALHLTGAQYRLILIVMQHSLGLGSSYAICDMCDKETPTLADWCAWLRIRPQAFCATRAELVKVNILRYQDGDPNHLAINDHWEVWDAALFSERAPRARSGRKPTTICNPPAINQQINGEDEQPLINRITDVNQQINSKRDSVNLQINDASDKNTGEPRQDQASSASAPTISEEDTERRQTNKRARALVRPTKTPKSPTLVRPTKDEAALSQSVPRQTPYAPTSPAFVRPTSSDRDELPEAHAQILRRLEQLPNWKPFPKKDAQILLELCPLSVGAVGGYDPAFVLRRVDYYEKWLIEKQVKTAPGILSFRQFMEHSWVRNEYSAWVFDHSRPVENPRAGRLPARRPEPGDTNIARYAKGARPDWDAIRAQAEADERMRRAGGTIQERVAGS